MTETLTAPEKTSSIASMETLMRGLADAKPNTVILGSPVGRASHVPVAKKAPDEAADAQ